MQTRQTFNQQQLDSLRERYSNIVSVDPCGETYTHVYDLIATIPDGQLIQIEAANINVLSSLARARMVRLGWHQIRV